MVAAIKRVVHSEWLLALNRVAMPVAMATVIWLFTTVMGIDRKQGLLEAENARQTSDIQELRQGRAADLATMGLLASALGKLGEKIDAQRDTLTRIHNYIDRQPSRP